MINILFEATLIIVDNNTVCLLYIFVLIFVVNANWIGFHFPVYFYKYFLLIIDLTQFSHARLELVPSMCGCCFVRDADDGVVYVPLNIYLHLVVNNMCLLILILWIILGSTVGRYNHLHIKGYVQGLNDA